MKKLETFEDVHRAITASPLTPHILTGDLNTPPHWASRRHRPGTEGRPDAAIYG